MTVTRESSRLLAALLCAAGLFCVGWAYFPGLRGDFLFDDFANLPSLGASGPVSHWPTFWRYITSGIADPTGRPITLLTFLFDGNDWPTSPYPFKRTNLAIHLVNGGLLTLLLLRLGPYVPGDGTPTAKRYAAVLAGVLWLAHPLFVSTVLYVVQREAMLPATFALLGMLGWLHGRAQLAQGRTTAGYLWVTNTLILCTLLGILCKANGALLPAYILTLEFTLLRYPVATFSRLREWRALRMFLLGVPTALVACYLLYQGYVATVFGISRPWTLPERLFTEPRVVANYLELLWTPRPFTSGLFNDQIEVSTGLLAPWTTLPVIVMLMGILAIALRLRRTVPTVALAIFFYFVGHAIESTTIPLELYYEHRNYVPAMFMFWPLALLVCGASQRVVDTGQPVRHPADPRAWLAIRLAIALVVVGGLLTMTRASSLVWGNAHTQALLWAQINPQSPRAQANAAAFDIANGHASRAIVRLEQFERDNPSHPYDPQITINILSARCELGAIDSSTRASAIETLRRMTVGERVIFDWLDRSIDRLGGHPCRGLDEALIQDMIDAASSNSVLTMIHGPRQDLFYLRGRLSLEQKKPDDALMWFDKALTTSPRPETAFAQVALLGSAGYPRQAMDHLIYFEANQHMKPEPSAGMPWVHAWVLQKQDYWPHEMQTLKATLANELARRAR